MNPLEHRIVPPISVTWHDHHHYDCDSIDGCLDATDWIAVGSTRDLPFDPSLSLLVGVRLIFTRMVFRP